MRLSACLWMPLAISSLTGCIWTNEGGLGRRYLSDQETSYESPKDSWNGGPILIKNPHGNVQIIGVPGKTNISVRARFVAGAASQEDANAAFEDVKAGVVIEQQQGSWLIDCPLAKEWHGSVDPISTGCTSLSVEVPAGSLDAPLEINSAIPDGGFHVSGITAKLLILQAPFGILADITPTPDAVVDLQGEVLASGMCSSVLRLPPDVSFAQADLSVDNPSVEFVDVDPNDPKYWPGVGIEGLEGAPTIPPRTGSFTWERPGNTMPSAQFKVHASIGKALLTTAPLPKYQDLHQCEIWDP